MRKYSRFHVLTLVVTVVMLWSLTITAHGTYSLQNEETGYALVMDDQAELLTEAQEEALLEGVMKPISAYGSVAFVSIDSNPYGSASSFADWYYHDLFGTKSGTLFLIDMDERMIYIFSDGEIYRTITSSKAEIITDNVYTYATDGDYYACAEKAFSQIGTLLDGGRIAQPMKYISNVLLAAVLALIINYLRARWVSGAMSASDSEWMQHLKSSFAFDDVTVTRTGVTKEYSPRSDSDSGGGGGGGSSGGGGGHSF